MTALVLVVIALTAFTAAESQNGGSPMSSPVTTDEYLKLRADQMREADLQACVENLARIHGWRAYHTHDSRRSQAGFPDLVLVRGDRVLFRELKTSTGRIRPEQRAWLDDLAAAGQDAAVWRPIHWFDDTIVRALDRTEHP